MLAGWLAGFLIGLRHACEPDHLAAVTTLLAEHPRPRHAVILGALWGAGHAATLLVAGGAMLLLRIGAPAWLSHALELGAAGMLIALGARAIRSAVTLGARGPASPHEHGSVCHAHPAAADHVHIVGRPLARRPLLVGVVHGLAGTGALAAFVLAEMPTVAAGLVYMLLFALGSVAGMAMLTGALGLPLAGLAHRPRLRRWALGATGALSIAIGLVGGAPLLVHLAG